VSSFQYHSRMVHVHTVELAGALQRGGGCAPTAAKMAMYLHGADLHRRRPRAAQRVCPSARMLSSNPAALHTGKQSIVLLCTHTHTHTHTSHRARAPRYFVATTGAAIMLDAGTADTVTGPPRHVSLGGASSSSAFRSSTYSPSCALPEGK
jgi:hypothetical protein